MKVRLGELRRFLRKTIQEQAWVPGRWYPSEGEPVDPADAERLGDPLGMAEIDELDQADARMLGDGKGPSEDEDYDIADHLRGDEEKTSLGDPPDETIREATDLNREIRQYILQEGPPGAGMVDPIGAKGFYSDFDMEKDHGTGEDLSATWYKSPGRPQGTEGDPFRGEDPHAQLGFHPPKGSQDPTASPPAVDGEEGATARLAPPIWQLSAGGDTSKVLGANAKPDTGGEESGDESEEGEEGSEAEPGAEGDEAEGEEQG